MCRSGVRRSLIFCYCVCSGSWQYPRRGGRVGRDDGGHQSVPRVQAEERGVHEDRWTSEGLDGETPDVAGVRSETRRGRVPLHRNRALRPGLARLRAQIHGLPQDVPGSRNTRNKPLSDRHQLILRTHVSRITNSRKKNLTF